MDYDPVIEILEYAESTCEHPGKAMALLNLQIVLRQDRALSKEIGKRMAAVLRCTEISMRRLWKSE